MSKPTGKQAGLRWTVFWMHRKGYLERKRENGKWVYSLTEAGREWTQVETARREEARQVAHEMRGRVRVPSNSFEVAAAQMLAGNWRPR